MIYSFQCKDCKEEFDIVASIEVFIVSNFACPHCRSKNVKRKYTKPNIIFNGKGFYSTDKRREKI